MVSPHTDLSPRDAQHVEAARGFFGLGLSEDAWQELEEVEPTARAAADVLALRVEILLALGRTDYARTIVAGAVRMHPEAGRCHYALALIEVATGNLPAAKAALATAFKLVAWVESACFGRRAIGRVLGDAGGVSPPGFSLAIPGGGVKGLVRTKGRGLRFWGTFTPEQSLCV